jgi:hypothetical protein
MKKIVTKLVSKLIEGKTEKATKEIISTVLGYLEYDDISIGLLENFTEDCKRGKIWSSTEFLNSEKNTTYNIFDYLNNKDYLPIIESLMWAKPILGSPNAATGDYEVMLLLTVPELFKPTQGDVEHPDYGKKNLKGDNPRLYCEILGKELNSIMIDVLEKYGLNPKKTKGVLYGQLMNKNYVNKHFNIEFEKTEIDNVKDILKTWLTSLFPSKKITKTDKEIVEIVEYCLVNGKLNWERWWKRNVLYIFKNSDNKKESFVVMSDNGKLIHLLEDIDNFRGQLEKNEIEMDGDYFRLNQSTKVGVYLKFN